MTIVLYNMDVSPPCRAVRLTAVAVGVDLALKEIDFMTSDHLKPEFIEINPQHVVPTIDDNGFYLWESRAIMGYLVEQYGKDDSLYPKDPKKRALVNQRLYFDLCTLYQAFSDYCYPMMFGNPPDQAKFEKVGTALELLDKFLEDEKYVAGKTLTIADISIATSVGNFEIIKYDISKYKNVTKWLDRMKKEIHKYVEIHEAGMESFKKVLEIHEKKKQNNQCTLEKN